MSMPFWEKVKKFRILDTPRTVYLASEGLPETGEIISEGKIRDWMKWDYSPPDRWSCPGCKTTYIKAKDGDDLMYQVRVKMKSNFVGELVQDWYLCNHCVRRTCLIW